MRFSLVELDYSFDVSKKVGIFFSQSVCCIPINFTALFSRDHNLAFWGVLVIQSYDANAVQTCEYTKLLHGILPNFMGDQIAKIRP